MIGYLRLWFVAMATVLGQTNYHLGTGISDMTGLASEGTLYGYAKPSQDARGIHTRQFARAFIFSSDDRRAAVVVCDVCMITQALHAQVLEQLHVLYGDLYNHDNVMLLPQHSHSTPGGMHTYYMYQAPSFGFINETFTAYTEGIVKAIQKAHSRLQEGQIYVSSGELLDASDNRSPYAYDNNPEEERSRYTYNTDKEMTILKIKGLTDYDLGMLSFFPVHTTSMKNYNHLVSGDNKGYASQMFERNMTEGVYPLNVTFVAGFAQSAEGDATPNTGGSLCNGTNELCTYNASTCPEDPNDPTLCTGRGPAGEQFEDTRIIGEKQFLKAKQLYSEATQLLPVAVDFRFIWVNMSSVMADVGLNLSCGPSMGYSFGAGATDGPGIYPFHQGMLEGIPEVDELIDRLVGVPEWLINCQTPKPILLPTAIMGNDTWTWQPEVVPLQLVRIGDVILIGVPGEITTMAGRRLSEAVRDTLLTNGYPETTRCIVTAMANSYSSYITTPEEYQVQRYEGASTIFGQFTINGYISEFVKMAEAMAKGEPVDLGEEPEDLRGFPDPSLGPIVTDATKNGLTYGDILVDTLESYQTGETAYVTFVSGNPRNNLMTDRTFLEVQRQLEDSSWVVEYTDTHWETKYIWLSNCQERPPLCLFPNITGCNPVNWTDYLCQREQYSNVTIEWDIPEDQQPGLYRLVHYGHARTRNDTVESYTGISSEFVVTQARSHVTRHHSKEYYIATSDLNNDGFYDEINVFRFLDPYL